MYVKKIICLAVYYREVVSMLRGLANCHDDYQLQPADGKLAVHSYKWLGLLYYRHVLTSLPSHSKAPRVVLIHKQFVLAIANDLLRVPKNFQLYFHLQVESIKFNKYVIISGNVIFGDYEPDEDECGLNKQQIWKGVKCRPAFFETAITDILAHPEHTSFKNTLAVAKLIGPLKSAYMIPICLPSLLERKRLRISRVVYMIDYISKVPLELDVENMAKRTLKLYSHEQCMRRYKQTINGTKLLVNAVCTTGCGIRSGAVVIRHDPDGMFELIGVSIGSALCIRNSMRRRFNREPPLYVDVYPYLSWIVSAITASIVPKPSPVDFRNSRAKGQVEIRRYIHRWRLERMAWRGHTFVAGNDCFTRSRRPWKRAFFYYESFSVHTDKLTHLRIFLKISGGIGCTITCVRIYLPNHKSTPIVDGIGGFNITIQMETEWFPSNFNYTVRLTGVNSSRYDIDRWWANRGVGMW